ncbi:hypothetical protein EV361DRAFT_1016061 [Lentinula raphanica]|nr:hypothetical protein EV361DRAFT_1016061 [Lentinula raphanica]
MQRRREENQRRHEEEEAEEKKKEEEEAARKAEEERLQCEAEEAAEVECRRKVKEGKKRKAEEEKAGKAKNTCSFIPPLYNWDLALNQAPTVRVSYANPNIREESDSVPNLDQNGKPPIGGNFLNASTRASPTETMGEAGPSCLVRYVPEFPFIPFLNVDTGGDPSDDEYPGGDDDNDNDNDDDDSNGEPITRI